MIMGVVYTLAITNFQAAAEQKEALSIKRLPALLASFDFEKEAKIVCFNGCKSCALYLDGEHITEYDDSLSSFFDDSIKSYRYSMQQGFMPIKERVFFTDEHSYEMLCFEYGVTNRGYNEALFIEFGGKVYDLHSRFEAKEYASLEQAREAMQRLENEVLR